MQREGNGENIGCYISWYQVSSWFKSCGAPLWLQVFLGFSTCLGSFSQNPPDWCFWNQPHHQFLKDIQIFIINIFPAQHPSFASFIAEVIRYNRHCLPPYQNLISMLSEAGQREKDWQKLSATIVGRRPKKKSLAKTPLSCPPKSEIWIQL